MQENANKSEFPRFLRILFRLVVLLVVLAIVLGAVVLFVVSAGDMFNAIAAQMGADHEVHSGELRLVMIESVDTILVATVLLVIAIGLFQLFVMPEASQDMPRWARVEQLDDLERRMVTMVVPVLSVIFLTTAFQAQNVDLVLAQGVAIAAIIIAVSAYLYVELKHHKTVKHEENDHTD